MLTQTSPWSRRPSSLSKSRTLMTIHRSSSRAHTEPLFQKCPPLVSHNRQTSSLLSTTRSSLISVWDFRDGRSLMGDCIKIMSKQEQEEMSQPIYMLACYEYLGKWKHKNDKSNHENFSHNSGISVHTLLIGLRNANVTSSLKQPTHNEVQLTKCKTWAKQSYTYHIREAGTASLKRFHTTKHH